MHPNKPLFPLSGDLFDIRRFFGKLLLFQIADRMYLKGELEAAALKKFNERITSPKEGKW